MSGIIHSRHFRCLAFVAIALSAGACVSFQNPIPEGYSGPTATITDTFSNHQGSSAHFFVLTRVDDVQVEDSGYRTRVGNSGRGFNMTPIMVSRKVKVSPQSFAIAGFVQFATDGQGIFGDHMMVEGIVRFAPQADKTYRVVGRLSKAGSIVWIENESGQTVGERVSNGRPPDPEAAAYSDHSYGQ